MPRPSKMPSQSEPVTPKGRATRALIVQRSAEAFAEHGYAETTLSELITRSGMAKGAFYFYFPSKEQLALAVLDEKQRQWLDTIGQEVLAKPTAIEQLHALGPAMIKLHRDDPSAYSVPRLSRDLSRIPELAGTIRANMADWITLVAGIITAAQQDGDVPATIDPRTVAEILIAATDGLKDLSDILDPPSRARRGFEARMQVLVDIVGRLTT